MRIQRGSNFDVFFFCFLLFLVDEGLEDPNTTISGPSLAHQKISLKWHFAGVP